MFSWFVTRRIGGFVGRRGAGAAVSVPPANAAAARRFIYRAGALREIVPNPVGFARSGILSPAGLLRLLGEPFLPRRVDGVEETVWEFAARRLGVEVADCHIMPMTLGIFAGNARRTTPRRWWPMWWCWHASRGPWRSKNSGIWPGSRALTRPCVRWGAS